MTYGPLARTAAATIFALESNGTVLAWGGNHSGQLGDGGTASIIGPVQVAGLADVSQVSAGWSFSLAVHVAPWVVLVPKG